MTTFRERIASEYESMLANEPRPMPEDFSPVFSWSRDKVTVEGGPSRIGLAFCITASAEQNWRAIQGLRESLWQAMELARLGRTEDHERMGITQ